MRILAYFAFVVLLSGCICSDTVKPYIGGSDDAGKSGCDRPYIRVGAQCCLDSDANGICDSDEVSGPSATTTTEYIPYNIPTLIFKSTTSTTTSTLVQTTYYVHTTVTTAPTCFDGIQNQGEEYADCGAPCEHCSLHKLTTGWITFKDTGYQFKLKEKTGSGANKQYWISVKTPDGLVDERPLSSGESFVDYLRVRVIDFDKDPDKPTVYIKYNTDDLSKLPAGASMLSIGGRSCVQSPEGLCERTYAGYRIRLVSRISSDDTGQSGGARVEVWDPGRDVSYKADIVEGRKTYSGDKGLVIGGFFDRSHIMVGGYSLFYVYTV